MSKPHTIKGSIIAPKTKKGISNLQIEAWEQDVKNPDLLGRAVTSNQGEFQFTFDESQWKDNYKDQNPIVFFRVFDAAGNLLRDTRGEIFWTAKQGTKQIIIPVELTTETTPSIMANVLNGKLINEWNRGIADAYVKLSQITGPGKTQPLAAGKTDCDGQFSLTYPELTKQDNCGAAIFELEFRKNAKSSLHEVRYELSNEQRSTIFEAKAQQKIWEGSEWNWYSKVISELVSATELEHKDTISWLHKITGIGLSHLEAYLSAKKLASKINIHEHYLYAFYRMGIQSMDRNELAEHSLDALEEILSKGVENFIIADYKKDWGAFVKIFTAAKQQSDQAKVQKTLNERFAFETPLKELLQVADLTTAEQNKVGAYLTQKKYSSDFWQDLNAEIGLSKSKVEKIRETFLIHDILIGNQALTKTHLATGSKTLASYSTAQWTKLIGSQKKFIEQFPGDNLTEKRNFYLNSIFVKLEQAHPMAFFKARLSENKSFPNQSNVLTFLDKNPKFEFGKQSIKKYIAENKQAFSGITIDDRKALVQTLTLSQVQYLAALPGENYKAVSILQAMKLNSMTEILHQGSAFLPKYIALGGSEHGGQTLVENVQTIAGFMINSFAGIHDVQNLPWVLQNETAQDVLADPELKKLFGSQDNCDCQHCRSIYSPAAYLADALHFLEREHLLATTEEIRPANSNSLYELLTNDNRRPDIKKLLLNCENANTPIPYIDLVNEVLLNAIDNENEISIDTTRCAEELAAYPVFTNIAASDSVFNILRNDIFPFNLPFDYHKTIAASWWKQLGTSQIEIQTTVHPNEGDLVILCQKQFGFSEVEWDLITLYDKYKANARESDLWGNTLPKTGVGNVRSWLEKTGLSLEEFTEVINTKFVQSVNAPQIYYFIEQADGSNKKICNLDEAEFAWYASKNGSVPERKNITPSQRKNIYKFIRLWKKLNWKIEEVDTLIVNVFGGAIDADKLTQLYPLAKLSEKWQVRPQDLLPIWNKQTTEFINERNLFYNLSDLNKHQVDDIVENWTEEGFGDPFQSPEKTLEFVEYIDRFRIGGFDYFQLKYLLNKSSENAPQDILRKIPSLKEEDAQKLTHTFLEHRAKSSHLFLEHNIKHVIAKLEELLNSGLWSEDLKIALRNVLLLPSENAENFVVTKTKEILNLLEISELELDETSSEIINILNSELEVSNYNYVLNFLELQFNFPAASLFEMLLIENDTFSEEIKELHKEKPFEDHKKSLALFHKLSVLFGNLTDLNNSFLPVYKLIKSDLQKTDTDILIAPEILVTISKCSHIFKLYTHLEPKEILAILTPEYEDDTSSSVYDWNNFNRFFEWNLKPEQWQGFDLANYIKREKPLEGFLNLHQLVQLIQKVQLPASVLKFENIDGNSLLQLELKIKNKYSEQQWLQQAKKVYAPVREKLRDALVSHLIHTNTKNLNSQEDLYKHFLLDTQMSACMMTSRLLQAILSLQLFVQRCLMNLEPNVKTSNSEDWKQWEWMNRYRVWEANRKVFAYPENWIEPELRDDKSSFFQELESELMQNEMTSDLGETALRNYLQKLEGVSNLEIMAMCRAYENSDASKDSYYIFGRTHGLPHQLYFRKYILSRSWTAWEKVEVDVEGDHLVPVVHNGKLHLFWPIFKEKAIKQTQTVPEAGADILADLMYWEIQMAWSVYENGKWGAKKLLKDIISEVDSSSQLDYFKLRAFEILKFDTLQRKSRIFFYVETNSTIRIFIPHDTENLALHGVLSINGNSVDYKRVNSEIKNYNSISWNTNYFPAAQFVEGGVVFVPVSDSEAFEYQRHAYYSASLDIESINRTRNSLIDLGNNSKEYRIISFKGESPITIGLNNKFVFNDQHNAILIERLKEPVLKKYFKATYLNSNVIIQKFVGSTVSYMNKLEEVSLLADQRQSIYNVDYSVAPGDINGELLFTAKEANSLYNWELFFHIPMYVAGQLTKNNRYQEAQKWYHLVFNPTTNSEDETAARYWIFIPFREAYQRNAAGRPLNIVEILMLLQEVDNTENTDDYITNSTDEVKRQIEDWRDNPFEPHRIARVRIGAYMKNVVMKYIDNLIAWGDELFRQDTMESITEATQIYMLASEILGRKPEKIPSTDSEDLSYKELQEGSGLDEFSNKLVELEEKIQVTVSRQQVAIGSYRNGIIPVNAGSGFDVREPWSAVRTNGTRKWLETQTIQLTSLYFCIPENEKLSGYWSTVSDRFFKLRNCLNIDGVLRQLPLYQPPIDPALLVRAKAMGLSIADALSDMNASLPHYRFQFMLQKALEYTQEVKSLASAFLGAVQSKDAEEFSLLRSRHEITILDTMRHIRRENIRLAREAVNAMELSKQMTESRLEYLKSRVKMTPEEKRSFYLKEDNFNISMVSIGLRQLAAMLANYPSSLIGAFITGIETGDFHDSLLSTASSMDIATQVNNHLISSSLERSSINLRWEEWKHQEQQTEIDLKRIEKELLSAEIRLALAEKEAENQELQMVQSQEQLDYMKSKFTNAQLYNWMSGQLATLYRQSFDMAYQLAKKAEKAWQHELGMNDQFVKYGHWDSLYKGLLSGEKLMNDLRRMETSYLDKNEREYELIKHVSLAQLDPLALLLLRENGTCEFEIPEVLFDMDHPGHYFRRLKSVSISMPCITGPYTSVNAKLTLEKNRYRKNKNIVTTYAEKIESTEMDDRFVYNLGTSQAIATSHAQNDSGIFELNFRDERYLPFEGAGAISNWKLELPTQVKQFNHASISDVILHIKYTAKEGGLTLKDEANKSLNEQLEIIEQNLEEKGLHTTLNLKQDLPNEWHLLKNNGDVKLTLGKSRLPYIAQGFKTKIEKVMILLRTAENPTTVMIDETPVEMQLDTSLKLYKGINTSVLIDKEFELYVQESDKLEELLMIVNYALIND